MNINFNHGAATLEESLGLLVSQGKKVECMVVFETLRQQIRNRSIFGPDEIIPVELTGFTGVLERSLNNLSEDSEKTFCLLRASKSYNIIMSSISAAKALNRLLQNKIITELNIMEETKLQMSIKAVSYVTDLVTKARESGEDFEHFLTLVDSTTIPDIIGKIETDTDISFDDLDNDEYDL